MTVTDQLLILQPIIQWTQNNCELELCHSKRGREDGKGKGELDGKETVSACTVQLKKFFLLPILTQSVAF
jgi:hypothetical protein